MAKILRTFLPLIIAAALASVCFAGTPEQVKALDRQWAVATTKADVAD